MQLKSLFVATLALLVTISVIEWTPLFTEALGDIDLVST